MIKAVLVDDEIRGLSNLRTMLGRFCKEVEIVGEATSLDEAEELFEELSDEVDVAFLDINMSEGLIFPLLDKLRPIEFDIIFVTAYNEHAIQACKYSSIDYILKPPKPELLKEAVSRIHPRAKGASDERLNTFQNVYNNPNTFEKIPISALDGIYFVNIRDIVRFEAEDNYTHIFLNDKTKITASRTIKAYEELLMEMNFYRVHKRHVINLNFIKKFVKGDGGFLVMDDGIKIEVSRRRRPHFMEQMRRLQDGFY